MMAVSLSARSGAALIAVALAACLSTFLAGPTVALAADRVVLAEGFTRTS